MNILFLAPIIPYPVIDGDRQRAYRLLQELADRHTVHFLGFIRDPAERENLAVLKKFCASAECVLITRQQLICNCLGAWFSRTPLNVAAFASSRMRQAVRRIVRKQQVECIHAYRLRMAPYALQSEVPYRVLDYTDAMTRQFQNRRVVQSGFLKQFYINHEIKRLANYEVAMSHQFNACLISSRLDREVLVEMGAAEHLQEVTNGVDTQRFRLVRKLPPEPALLFLGNLEYAPNWWGLQHFCQETWPRIREKLPTAQLNVIGKIPAEMKSNTQRKFEGVNFLGVVPDLKKYFFKARVAVCPLEVASGRQFKVIEYFAAGLPAVTTTIVADNLGARPNCHCLVADTPADFAQQVYRLCQEDRLAERLRRAARVFVEKNYDWSIAVARLRDIYADMMNVSYRRRKK